MTSPPGTKLFLKVGPASRNIASANRLPKMDVALATAPRILFQQPARTAGILVAWTALVLAWSYAARDLLPLARREPWREPHRLHAYQRLTNTGLSHAAVSAAVLVCTAAVSGLGLVSLGDRFPSRLFADLLAVVLIAGYLVSPSLRRAAVQA